MTDVLSYARADWDARAGNHDTSNTGGLADIFRDSGWSNRVDIKDGRVRDWCGMACAAWYFRAGLHPSLRREFWHTENVAALFTYGLHGTRRRHHTRVTIDGVQRDVQEWHRALGKPRGCLTRRGNGALDQIPWRCWDTFVRPGDILLIAHRGQADSANHICMVERIEGHTIHCLDGNARGMQSNGKRGGPAVVRIARRIDDDTERAKINLIGRLSPLDFTRDVVYA
jgi:hypothetical protein